MAVVFDGKNYDLWEKVVVTALRAKNKLGFLKGIVKKPVLAEEGDPMELQAWEIVNSMISSWILNVIDPRLQSSIAFTDLAYAMWTTLKKRYSVANVPKIHKLKANIADCKQGGLDMVEFYSKLSDIWSELENLVKIPY